jgi:hypothetical protein
VDTLEFEFGKLEHANAVPPDPKIWIASEPFLQEVLERHRLHFTAKVIAEVAGSNNIILVRFAAIDPGEEVVFGSGISGYGYSIFVTVANHAMLAVKAKIMLRCHYRIEVRHSVVLHFPKGLSSQHSIETQPSLGMAVEIGRMLNQKY